MNCLEVDIHGRHFLHEWEFVWKNVTIVLSQPVLDPINQCKEKQMLEAISLTVLGW